MDLNIDPFEDLIKCLVKISPSIKSQLDLIDLMDDSFLKRLIETIKNLDSNEISDNLKAENLELLSKIMNILVENGEIDHKDFMIFTKRGAMKSSDDNVQRRRDSFVNTKFCDHNIILKSTDLVKMTNLNFIFSMNGYHLPYCDSKNQRGMYEHFFAAFLKEYDEIAHLSNCYNVLLESIMILYVTTEMMVDIFECFFEIINIVNLRIKSCSVLLDITQVRRFNELKEEVLQFLMTEFNSNERVYHMFKTRKLLKMQSSRDDRTDKWTEKIETYIDNMFSAIDKHKLICDVFVAKMNELKHRNDVDDIHKKLCSDISIYVQSYQSYAIDCDSKNSNFRRTMKAVVRVLKHVDQIELSLSIKSPRGGSPRANPGRPQSVVGKVWNFLSPRGK